MTTNRKIACLALITALALSCSLAGAGEVVRFQDGRYLKVEGHQVHGEAVKLMMANQSIIVLPLERVDSIRSGGVMIYNAAGRINMPAEQLQAVVREPRTENAEPANRKRGQS